MLLSFSRLTMFVVNLSSLDKVALYPSRDFRMLVMVCNARSFLARVCNARSYRWLTLTAGLGLVPVLASGWVSLLLSESSEQPNRPSTSGSKRGFSTFWRLGVGVDGVVLGAIARLLTLVFVGADEFETDVWLMLGSGEKPETPLRTGQLPGAMVGH